ncbi:CsbD family protein [Streptomyces sioyaensis]
MSISKKIAHKAEAMKGGAKKSSGRATGSRRLQAEGRGPGPRRRVLPV